MSAATTGSAAPRTVGEWSGRSEGREAGLDGGGRGQERGKGGEEARVGRGRRAAERVAGGVARSARAFLTHISLRVSLLLTLSRALF